MKRSHLVTIVVLAVITLFVLYGSASASYTTVQISENAYSYSDRAIAINEFGQVVWLDDAGEIYVYSDGVNFPLAPGIGYNWELRINNNGQVVCTREIGSDSEIVLYSGGDTTQLTNNSTNDFGPEINDSGQVVWTGHGHDGPDSEIFLYNGRFTMQLTDNSTNDLGPGINGGGQVVWTGHDGSDSEIFLYNGVITQLTNNSVDDFGPGINDSGQVVWVSSGQLFIYSGGITTQIAGNVYSSLTPRINSSGQVVWTGHDGSDSEIFLYSGGVTTQLTSNSVDDWNPQINDRGQVSWSDNSQVLVWSEGMTTVIEPGSGGHKPRLNNSGQIAWYAYVNGSAELFLSSSDAEVFIPIFDPAVNYSAGAFPASVTSGDFNNDGRADLAAADYERNNVSIFLGNGDGTIETAAYYGAGTSPVSVATRDFNADGKADLAVANNDSNDVSILLGNGNGTFAARVSYSVGQTPNSVTAGDFNNDGIVDLATANSDSSNISILLGNGNGTFDAAAYYGAGTSPVSVATGDFNNDDNTDLAVANSDDNNVSILLGSGDGSLSLSGNFSVGAIPVSIVAGDFDVDGMTDVAVVNMDSHSVSILQGNGDGTLDPEVRYNVGTNPFSLAGGDFDSDGDVDIAVASISSSNISILSGNGNGTFAKAENYSVESGPISVATSDLNNDGKTDLAVSTAVGNISVLINKYYDETLFIDKYIALAGAPGAPTGGPQPIAGGMYQNFTNGRMIWNEASNTAYWVHGAILTKYDELGGMTGVLGLPIGDEQDVVGVDGARESRFTSGTIFWGPGVGTFALTDPDFVEMFYANNGAEYLGIPTCDIYSAWDGRAQNFQKAIFTWNPRQGAHYVRGGVMVKYLMTGGPKGYLHLIIDEEKSLSPPVSGHADAVAAIFENGRVYWSGTTGSHIVNGGVYVTYMSFGGPQGHLGLPITDEYPLALPGGAARSRFEHGFITWWAIYGTWIDAM